MKQPPPDGGRQKGIKMAEFVLSCCSTADAPMSFFEERDIKVQYFRWIDNSQTIHVDDLGQSMPYSEFYQRMRDGMTPTTSQPNFQDFIDFFEPVLKEGKDVLHLSLGSGISGAYGSAMSAAEALNEKYPDRKVLVADSCTASSGYALLMHMLWLEKKKGKSLEECYQWVLDNRIHAVTWFFPATLTWLVRGGRVKPMAGFIGNILNICPILYIVEDGSLAVQTKVRGQNKAMQYVAKKIASLGIGGEDYSGRCIIAQSDCREDAQKLADMLTAAYPKMEKPVEITDVGCVIGAHLGPGAMVLSFWGEDRVEKK